LPPLTFPPKRAKIIFMNPLRLFAFILLLAGTALADGSLEFTSERIEMSVRGNVLTIHGIYHFTNPNPEPVRVTMFYPFPIDATHPFPYAIRVKPIAYRKVKDGITWTVEAGPNGKPTVDVVYSQRCLDRSAKYILTTTQAWGQALKQAEFIVRVPSSFKEVTLSYSPDSLKEIKGEQVFYLTRKDFLPEKDLEVRWK
jgi:hypothetical protein